LRVISKNTWARTRLTLPLGIVVGVGNADKGRAPPLPSGITSGTFTGVTVAGVDDDAGAIVRVPRGGELAILLRVANGFASISAAVDAGVAAAVYYTHRRYKVNTIVKIDVGGSGRTVFSSLANVVGNDGTTSAVTPSSRTNTIAAAL
jgi:hypothetical protein